ncbi:MAG: UDP-N-acetylmuramoyl-tripeptide--D-alanyl-D-alanine ligase [Candidatus Krumholzibacteria bacterium]|nr:UDP-N-acetylmuramoyl-tripeptide--D-alanyl-D-alanine ligase [Candidatus Krumholzibacteria bacterium]
MAWRSDIRIEFEWIAEQLRKRGFKRTVSFDGEAAGFTIDTRTDCQGRIYVALKGENLDGHDFVGAAVDGGASAVIVDRDWMMGSTDVVEELREKGSLILDVDDTLKALQHLAFRWRDRVAPKVLAITGSTGKTGTKEIARSILSGRYRVHATEGNYNNHIGLPLTILSMPEDTEVLVVEMGASGRGEIAVLAGIARPDVGVITNIGPSHLEFFGSLKGVARAKSELIARMNGKNTVVLPADDEFFEYLSSRTEAEIISFGFSESAEFGIKDLTSREDAGFSFSLTGTAMETRRHGKHNVLNAAAAVAAVSVLGLGPDDAVAAVAASEPVRGRGVIFDIAGLKVIDDSYNSNPVSLRAAIDSFMEMEIEGKRWLVLGDMLELGKTSAELHAEAGIYCGKAGVHGLLTLGKDTVSLSREAAVQRKAPESISHFLEVEKLALYLDSMLEGGDAVLIKGSRGMHMEMVIEELERLRDSEKRRVD